MRPPPVCTYCNKPAPWLCDYILGWRVDENTRLITPECLQITCDVPLCDEHSIKKPWGFVCRPCRQIVDDFCPEHRAGNKLDGEIARITQEEGHKIREVLHGKVRDKVLLHTDKTIQFHLDL